MTYRKQYIISRHDMTVKRIICSTPIEAEGFRVALAEAGIESVTYDETNSKVDRGILDQTTEIMVKEEDYEQAMKVFQTYQSEHEAAKPWCPKCGSENVTACQKKNPNFQQLPRILATLLAYIPFGCCTTKRFVCNDCGHKWER